MQKQTLFTTDIYKLKVKSHDRIKNFLTTHLLDEFIKNGPNSEFCNVYSDYFPNAKQLYWDDLLALYEPTITEFFEGYGFDTLKDWKVGIDAWYNVTTKGGFGEIHNHLSSPRTIQFCAVHYVKFDESVHTPTIFYNSESNGIRSTQPTPIADNLPTNFPKEQCIAEAVEGDMVFFPPYLNHSIPVQKHDVPRITTAFNITITDS